ncbi:hypothetical protein CK203_051221 [Vitis vinifera]|uniref:Uncharacterized protein n=1 Tax=Vitis vinifera TaxID=29760 RepID=A0A438H8C1_VITVI|nr:hypothetical protein CK203_051221 [Vitis vinifera]
MDQQSVIVDQFTTAMASIQEALTTLRYVEQRARGFEIEIKRVCFFLHLPLAGKDDFGYLVLVLYDVDDDISRGLWSDFSPVDAKWKKPVG